MPFKIVRNDITKMTVDSIVNSANPNPVIGGGVDFAIHEAGGKDLAQARIQLGSISVGDVKYTQGYNLPSNYVFHTVGPIWESGDETQREQLYSCYMNSLLLARELNLKSIAFPLISAGVFGCPRKTSLDIASKAINNFLTENDMMIYLVVFDHDSYIISKELYSDIESYMTTKDVVLQSDREFAHGKSRIRRQEVISDMQYKVNASYAPSLVDELDQIDGTWQETLFEIIRQRELKDSIVYNKANIDRKLFSKIRNDKYYHPSKKTAIALCLALELELEDTLSLISRAGYDLSLGIKFDVILRYFIKKKEFKIMEINYALFDFDQEVL